MDHWNSVAQIATKAKILLWRNRDGFFVAMLSKGTESSDKTNRDVMNLTKL